MVDRALDTLDLAAFDIMIVENVGNLVCPTHWALGEHLRLCILSTAEGHDKPIKYPQMFVTSDAIILNKIDLIELVDFEREFFYESVRALNPEAPIFEVSCRTGEGITAWADWLLSQRGIVGSRQSAESGRQRAARSRTAGDLSYVCCRLEGTGVNYLRLLRMTGVARFGWQKLLAPQPVQLVADTQQYAED